MTQSQIDRAVREAELLTAAARLARASGCPEGAPVMPWCLEHGLIELGDDGEFRLTARSRTRAVE
jgi:hypothetical protein